MATLSFLVIYGKRLIYVRFIINKVKENVCFIIVNNLKKDACIYTMVMAAGKLVTFFNILQTHLLNSFSKMNIYVKNNY